MKKEVSKVKMPNHCEFLNFLMTNYDYKHDYWKLNHDLSLRLREEEERAAFFNSDDFDEFKALMQLKESAVPINEELSQKLKSFSHLKSLDP